jgi:hypothetical protein
MAIFATTRPAPGKEVRNALEKNRKPGVWAALDRVLGRALNFLNRFDDEWLWCP